MHRGAARATWELQGPVPTPTPATSSSGIAPVVPGNWYWKLDLTQKSDEGPQGGTAVGTAVLPAQQRAWHPPGCFGKSGSPQNELTPPRAASADEGTTTAVPHLREGPEDRASPTSFSALQSRGTSTWAAVPSPERADVLPSRLICSPQKLYSCSICTPLCGCTMLRGYPHSQETALPCSKCPQSTQHASSF